MQRKPTVHRRSQVPKVWVEIDRVTRLALRIFRNKKMAVIYVVDPSRGLAPEPIIVEMDRAIATGQIRRQVFERDGYCCVKCGLPVVWERHRSNSGEMDEVQARGDCRKGGDGQYHSGEVSVANGQTLCKACHTGPGGKQDRSPSFSSSRFSGIQPNQANTPKTEVKSFAELYQEHRDRNEQV